eukprot:m.38518 g.38518  ORF g.38518 m.38518 type:complete len:1180 (+) comp5890_c0_seq1:41-3580(+)
MADREWCELRVKDDQAHDADAWRHELRRAIVTQLNGVGERSFIMRDVACKSRKGKQPLIQCKDMLYGAATGVSPPVMLRKTQLHDVSGLLGEPSAPAIVIEASEPTSIQFRVEALPLGQLALVPPGSVADLLPVRNDDRRTCGNLDDFRERFASLDASEVVTLLDSSKSPEVKLDTDNHHRRQTAGSYFRDDSVDVGIQTESSLVEFKLPSALRVSKNYFEGKFQEHLLAVTNASAFFGRPARLIFGVYDTTNHVVGFRRCDLDMIKEALQAAVSSHFPLARHARFTIREDLIDVPFEDGEQLFVLETNVDFCNDYCRLFSRNFGKAVLWQAVGDVLRLVDGRARLVSIDSESYNVRILLATNFRDHNLPSDVLVAGALKIIQPPKSLYDPASALLQLLASCISPATPEDVHEGYSRMAVVCCTVEAKILSCYESLAKCLGSDMSVFGAWLRMQQPDTISKTTIGAAVRDTYSKVLIAPLAKAEQICRTLSALGSDLLATPTTVQFGHHLDTSHLKLDDILAVVRALVQRKKCPALVVCHADPTSYDTMNRLLRQLEELVGARKEAVSCRLLVCATSFDVKSPCIAASFTSLDAVICEPALLVQQFGLTASPLPEGLAYVSATKMPALQDQLVPNDCLRECTRAWLRGEQPAPADAIGTMVPIFSCHQDWLHDLKRSLKTHHVVDAHFYKQHQRGCGASTTLQILSSLFMQEPRTCVISVSAGAGSLKNWLPEQIDSASKSAVEVLVFVLDEDTSDCFLAAELAQIPRDCKLRVCFLRVFTTRAPKRGATDSTSWSTPRNAASSSSLPPLAAIEMHFDLCPICETEDDIRSVCTALRKVCQSMMAMDAVEAAALKSLKSSSLKATWERHFFVFGITAFRDSFEPMKKLVQQLVRTQSEFWCAAAFLDVFSSPQGMDLEVVVLDDFAIDLDAIPLVFVNASNRLCFAHPILPRFILKLQDAEFDALLRMPPGRLGKEALTAMWTRVFKFLEERVPRVRWSLLAREVLINRSNGFLSPFVSHVCFLGGRYLAKNETREDAVNWLRDMFNLPCESVLGDGHSSLLLSRVYRLWAYNAQKAKLPELLQQHLASNAIANATEAAQMLMRTPSERVAKKQRSTHLPCVWSYSEGQHAHYHCAGSLWTPFDERTCSPRVCAHSTATSSLQVRCIGNLDRPQPQVPA